MDSSSESSDLSESEARIKQANGKTTATEETTVTERDNIRKELSNMSFEELQKLKETMGEKLLHQTMFGLPPKRPQMNYKRANKNRPMETSSKIPPPKIKISKGPKIKNERLKIRDPRFDPLCGSFDKTEFKQNYKFLGNVRKNERTQLKKDYDSCEDPKKKQQIKLMMQRIDNQIREQEKTEARKQKLLEERLENREKIKRGEKPVFKKKSERKVEDLVSKYEELKKTNQLQKHIEKRSKKLAQKEKRTNRKPENV